MKKISKAAEDTMREEYGPSQLKGGVPGKYYRRASAGTNLVVIDPDLFELFPNTEAVNRALRLLAQTANMAIASKPGRKRS